MSADDKQDSVSHLDDTWSLVSGVVLVIFSVYVFGKDASTQLQWFLGGGVVLVITLIWGMGIFLHKIRIEQVQSLDRLLGKGAKGSLVLLLLAYFLSSSISNPTIENLSQLALYLMVAGLTIYPVIVRHLDLG